LVMDNVRAGSFQSKVGAVSRQAGIVSKTLGVVAEAELVVCVVLISELGVSLAFRVGFDPETVNAFDPPVGPFSFFSKVPASLHFQVINVLWIELGSYVGSDVGIRNWDAIEQP